MAVFTVPENTKAKCTLQPSRRKSKKDLICSPKFIILLLHHTAHTTHASHAAHTAGRRPRPFNGLSRRT